MWDTGSIPTKLGCTVLVLILKETTNTWEIGLLELVWKVVKVVIDNRIKLVVKLYDVLYVFCAGMGTGTAIMEHKLVQELASVDQDPLFSVLLDLRKAYNNLDQGRLLQNLEGYGAGPKLWGLLVEFWLG